MRLDPCMLSSLRYWRLPKKLTSCSFVGFGASSTSLVSATSGSVVKRVLKYDLESPDVDSEVSAAECEELELRVR